MKAIIQDKALTDDDIGRHVIYIPNHAPDDPKQWEHGVLSSFREDGAIFVRFKSANGERCEPHNLRWEIWNQRFEPQQLLPKDLG